MKNKRSWFIIVLCLFFLAAGCNRRVPQETGTNSSLKQITIDCNQYRGDIVEHLKSEDNKDNSAIAKGERINANRRLLDLFYSPKVSGCLYTFVVENTFKNGTKSFRFILDDVKTHQLVTYQDAFNDESSYEAKLTEFTTHIQVYR